MSDTPVQHQQNTHTQLGRNAEMMRLAANHLGAEAPLRALSFGCSDGSECLDFAKVFPNATVVGADVDAKALATARALNHPRIQVVLSTPANIAPLGPFDVIFAMNVLCIYPQTDGLPDIAQAYPFDKFDEEIQRLDSYLKPGGVLGIFNAQYYFDDTRPAAKYKPLVTGSYKHGAWITRYRPDGRPASNSIFEMYGTSYTLPQWREFTKTQPAAYTGMRHEWVDDEAYSGRHTDVSLWVKQA
ncbi:methyltransferase domain protein [Asticcacaulis biprosthecium C19]|uniref:Methyltransferase domain protein n=1 Tax=Asticcacaulis biprosthecium C19 TaxID=715226 RepID=F4QM10_9CAUL|nr:class I SAM-dependent methyltransferase [Asticcacaulis biprosthecium]EGF93582.1 methyltransferase domain protein [Asticcacaulis biprosthecium C19]